METEPMVSPQSPKSPVSQEDCGLWMEVACKPAEDTDIAKDNSSLTYGEKPCEAWQAVIPPSPPLVTAGHPDRMEEDDDVFILPPPCKDPSCPEEGSTMEPNLKVSGGAISVTEANENPRSLDGVHAEQPSSSPVVVKATVRVEEERLIELKKGGSVDITVLTEGTGSATPPPTDGHKAVGASSPEQPHPNMEVSILKETDPVPSSQTRECEPEHCLDNNSPPTHEGTIMEPEHTDESNSDVEDMVDGRSPDYDMTKDEWVRRGSASSDVQPHHSISRGLSREQVSVPSPQSPASEPQELQEAGSLTVAKDIQQGKQEVGSLTVAKDIQQGKQEAGSLTVAKDIQQGKQEAGSLTVAKDIQQEKQEAGCLTVAKDIQQGKQEAGSLTVAKDIQQGKQEAGSLTVAKDIQQGKQEAGSLTVAKDIQQEKQEAGSLTVAKDIQQGEQEAGSLTVAKDIQQGEQEAGSLTVAKDIQQGKQEAGSLTVAKDIQQGEQEAGSLTVAKDIQQGEQEAGSLTVAKDIQQGEQLLHRLHLVQQRQDGQQVPQEPPPSQQVAMKTANQDTGYQEVERIKCRREEEEEEEGGIEGTGKESEQGGRVQLHTVEVEERAVLSEEDTEIPEEEDIQTVGGEKAEEVQSRPSAQLSVQLSVQLSAQLSAQLSVQPMVRMETECSDDDQSDSGVSTDFSPVGTHEIHTTPAPTTDNKAPQPQKETPIEREIRRTAEREQSLGRSRCMSNTQEGQEVVDIPLMKTPLLAKTLSSKVGPGQGADWQFSEKKMQKEISQEIQRELVLVNMGKIPGVYSKGTVRQMRERKLLFEAFQQGNAEGPARHKRPPTTAGQGMRGHVYPSVLERTRSMELVSLKGCPLSRAHSHQMFDLKGLKEASSGQNPGAERQPEDKGAERKLVILESDDTIIAHYPKQDRGAQRLYRSLDCLSIGGTDEEATDEVRGEQPGEEDESSDILRENPFFKLRPSLAMKPEVEKDIREAREREEELRRQRCSLYGEIGVSGGKPDSTEDPSSDTSTTLTPSSTSSFKASVDGRQSKGKLDRTWPPPNPKSARENPGLTQKAGGQKTPLWQRWEAGMVNRPLPREQD